MVTGGRDPRLLRELGPIGGARHRPSHESRLRLDFRPIAPNCAPQFLREVTSFCHKTLCEARKGRRSRLDDSSNRLNDLPIRPRPPSGPPVTTDTRTQILDVAEHLFAERGVSATSVRRITATAGVNVAAVHYHFRSRQGLVRELFERRLGPLNAERLRLLDELEATNADPSIEALLETLLRPVFALGQDPGGNDFVRLLGSIHNDPDPELLDLLDEQFTEMKRRFLPAMAKALPHLSRAELFWRMHFVIGAMARSITGSRGLERLSDGVVTDADDWDGVRRRLVAFAAAGLRAPATAPDTVTTDEEDRR